MPFTLAHPAAVIPLARRGRSLSALVIGSMAPDFLYFLQLSPRGHFGHTWLGIFCFCLPLGWLVFLLFHRLLKFPLLALFPLEHQQRLLEPAQNSPGSIRSKWFSISLLICLGAVTHIVWDSFTHEHGWTVTCLPFLAQPAFACNSLIVPWYKVLQHTSTLTGFLLLFLWYRAWFRQAQPAKVPAHFLTPFGTRMKLLGGILSLAGIVASLYAWQSVAVHFTPWTFNVFLTRTGVATLSFSLLGLICYSVIWQRHHNHKAVSEH